MALGSGEGRGDGALGSGILHHHRLALRDRGGEQVDQPLFNVRYTGQGDTFNGDIEDVRRGPDAKRPRRHG